MKDPRQIFEIYPTVHTYYQGLTPHFLYKPLYLNIFRLTLESIKEVNCK